MPKLFLFFLSLAFASASLAQSAPRFKAAEWQLATSFAGEHRDDASGFALNGRGFLGCGIDRYFNLRNDWWQYDPASGNWSAIDTLPGLPRQYATAVSDGSKAFLIGGSRSDGMYSNEVFRYTSGGGWTQLEDAPFMPRAAGVGVTVGGKAFYGTGRNDTLKFSDFWMFDFGREEWTQLDSCPFAARDEMVGFEANGFLYFLLGRSFDGVFADCWRYDPLSEEWLQLKDYPGQARAYASALAEPGGAVIAGGDSEDGVLLDESYYFEAAAETWSQMDRLSEPIRGMEGFRLDAEIYFCGGLTKNFTRVNTVQLLASNRVEVETVLRVWPVPARDELNYYFNIASADKLKLQLVSQAGELILESELSSYTFLGQLDLERVGAGLYYLRLQNATGASVQPLVIVK